MFHQKKPIFQLMTSLALSSIVGVSERSTIQNRLDAKLHK
jgi:hypothetical protein